MYQLSFAASFSSCIREHIYIYTRVHSYRTYVVCVLVCILDAHNASLIHQLDRVHAFRSTHKTSILHTERKKAVVILSERRTRRTQQQHQQTVFESREEKKKKQTERKSYNPIRPAHTVCSNVVYSYYNVTYYT